MNNHGSQTSPQQHAQGELNDHEAMLHKHHVKMLWTNFTNITLGVWLLTAPVTFEYGSRALAWSDFVSGAAIILCATLSLWQRFGLARWGECAVGIWLLFAPLLFWASAAVYLQDTLIGALVIGLSVLVPMMPGKAHHMVMMLPGPDAPPGWGYNPSTWWQRGPIIALAFVGFFISRYLAAYQLGHISSVWDPFFDDGTRRILESEVSRAWPVSDAGLGAIAYMLEALSGYMGSRTRWRTMPWMVAMFGFLVVPLGITSIVLIILQPVAVGAWCTLCLITAAAMLVMITPSLDEVIAMVQFLIAARREGQPFWRTFWVGGTLKSVPATEAAPRKSMFTEFITAMNWETLPWNLLVATALGIWLMFAPTTLGSSDFAADSDHLIGALVITFAVIAIGEVARPVRFLLLPFGLWLIAAPWLLEGAPPAARWNDMLVGAALVILSLPRGRVVERYGTWNAYIV